MKHNLLRRLSSLSLALVMAASLCLTPAWAAPVDPNDPPEPATMTVSSRVIMLNNTSSSYGFIIGGLSKGETVTITRSSTSITIDNVSSNFTKTIDTEENGHGQEQIEVSIGATSTLTKETITVSRTDSSGKQISGAPDCYVYCNSAPIQVTPDPIPTATAGKEFSVTVTVNDAAVAQLLTGNDIGFSCNDDTAAEVTEQGYIRPTFTATIMPKRPLYSERVNITMTMTGGYTRTWPLSIDPAPGVNYVNFIQLGSGKLEMTAGDTYTFPKADITILPGNATNKELTWSVTNQTGKATVDENGTIKALEAGTVVITATAKDGGGAHGECTVTIKESASGMTLDPTSLVLSTEPGGQYPNRGTITPTLSGANRDRVEIRWTTSNATAAAFDSAGKNNITTTGGDPVTIFARKSITGPITITAVATFKNDKGTTTATVRKTCSVTVLDADSIAITSMTLSETSHKMPEDGSFTLTVKSVTPANAPVKTVKWSTSDPTESIIRVDDSGKVTAMGPGEAAVIATADYGGARAVCTVTVTEKAETIRLNFGYDSNSPIGSNKYTYTFRDTGNDYVPVTAVLTPSGTYGAVDPIRWTSKNPSVATVTNTTSTKVVVNKAGPGRTTISAIPMDPQGKDRAGVDPAEITITVSGVTIVNDSDSVLNTLTLLPGSRQTVLAQAWGAANNGNSSCDWSSSDPSIVTANPKNGESTILTARAPGTAIITARKGSYTATCTVTVTEDSIGLIDGISTKPGVAYQFSNLAGRLQSACSQKTGSTLSYVTNLTVASTDQGILHDQHHSSADTGAGVGLQDRYYPGTAPQGQRSLNDLSFVPKNTFSGVAEINYTAWAANNQSFSGIIRINVNGTGDVSYASSEGSVVTFLADDFNLYHPNLRSVSFTLPLDSRGTLYYGYTSPSQPGTKVTANTAYYRSGTPSLDRVSFVPAAGYKGTVTISYTATDTSGRTTPGTVTISVDGGNTSAAPGDLYYPVAEDSWVTFRSADFSSASLAVLGEPLSYVRFSLPKSSDGTLFYNYRGFGNYDSAVDSTTSYYNGGTPSLGGVSFVPTTTTPSQVDINYTGYTVRGNTFTGTIHIGQNDPTQQQNGLRYTVFTGKSVYFNAADFNTACVTATGASLSYVQFSPLPAVGEGTLRYTRGTNSTTYNLSTSTRCYRTSSSTSNVLLGSVSFLANNSFTGTVTIPFTGYNTNNVSFTGQVIITVTPPTSGDSVFYGTTASPIQLSSSRMRSACGDSLDGTLSYITFNSLPSASAGRLYVDYSRIGTGTQVSTGTRYYVSGSGTPTIDQISFVPRGRYGGQVSVPYTATSTNGRTTTGIITFNISNTGNSTYFTDMSNHTWAGPAVDFLYRNSITNGVTANTYGPDQRILRCDFVLMLCRAFRFTGGSGYSFADVPTNAYYADAVATAKRLGIVNGDGVNFMPNSELTRQDAMVMIKNALDAAGWNVGTASTSILGRFPDGTGVASYARDAVSTLVQMGAVNGDNGMLYPYNPITRAEAAMILHFVMTM